MAVRRGSARVGVVSDSALHRFAMQALVREYGHRLAVSCGPSRIDGELLERARADVWLVSFTEECDCESATLLMSDALEVPVILGEAGGGATTDPAFGSWRRGLVRKLKAVLTERADCLSADAQGMNPLLECAAELSRNRSVASEVWVLGASLGGPEALVEFLSRIPADLPASFVYAQHIDANCAATLTRVVARKSTLSVVDLGEGSVLCQGQLGIVPVGEALDFLPLGRVRASGGPWPGRFAPAIDAVVAGVARAFGNSSGAIIFSGMGDDGAAGCSLMQQLGGRVWVQSPGTCICPGMPEAVQRRGCVHFVDSPLGLAQALVERYQ